jgi:hypothetical protein
MTTLTMNELRAFVRTGQRIQRAVDAVIKQEEQKQKRKRRKKNDKSRKHPNT